jgi:hypothetical protein
MVEVLYVEELVMVNGKLFFVAMGGATDMLEIGLMCKLDSLRYS